MTATMISVISLSRSARSTVAFPAIRLQRLEKNKKSKTNKKSRIRVLSSTRRRVLYFLFARYAAHHLSQQFHIYTFAFRRVYRHPSDLYSSTVSHRVNVRKAVRRAAAGGGFAVAVILDVTLYRNKFTPTVTNLLCEYIRVSSIGTYNDDGSTILEPRLNLQF